MKVRIFLAVLLFLACTAMEAQQSRHKIYNLAQKNANTSYDDLLDLVDQNLQHKEDIALFFYYWIAQNIAYDTEVQGVNFGSPVIAQDAQPYTVFKKRKATCLGFTNLYSSFLSYFGIDHRTIMGYSRHRDNLLKKAKPAPDHAWSAIWLNGQWQLVETTWANLYIDRPKLRDFYFMSDPAEFSMDHLPLDDQWQFTSTPLGLDEFSGRSFVDPRYFAFAKDRSKQLTVKRNEKGEMIISTARLTGWRIVPIAVNQSNQQVAALKYQVKSDRSGLKFIIKNPPEGYIIRLDAQKNLTLDRFLKEIGIAFIGEPDSLKKRVSEFAGVLPKPNRHR